MQHASIGVDDEDAVSRGLQCGTKERLAVAEGGHRHLKLTGALLHPNLQPSIHHLEVVPGLDQLVVHPERGVTLAPELMPDPVHPGVCAEEDAHAAESGRGDEPRVGVTGWAEVKVCVVRDDARGFPEDERYEGGGRCGGVDEPAPQVEEHVREDEAEHVRE